MKTAKITHSVQKKGFLVFSILLCMTALALFLCFLFTFERVYLKQTNDYMGDITKQATENVDYLIENIDQLSINLLSNGAVQSGLKQMNSYERNPKYQEEIQSISSQISGQLKVTVFNQPAVSTVRIYSDYGDEVRIGTANQEYLEYEHTKEELYERSGGAVWEMAGDANYLCLSRAILSFETMKPIGYMVVICDNSAFSDSLYRLSNSYTSKVYILDEKENIIISNSEGAIGTKFPYSIEDLSNNKGNTITDPETSEECFYYSGKTMKSGWKMITLIRSKEYHTTIWLSMSLLLLLVGVALIVAVIFTKFVVRDLFAPTQKILTGMESFGNGNLDMRVELATKDEFGQIAETYNHMADNIQNLLEKVLKLEIAQKEAEIEVLKMQINPHFLYNTLDTISWMGIMQGNEEVSDISVSLANLLRANIKNDFMISVKEELATVRDYLRIQSYRFGDKIEIVYEINSEVEEYKMPNFLLQPLIENAVIHGFEGSQKTEKGKLLIKIDVDEQGLIFIIADDGVGMTKDELQNLIEQCQDLSSHSSIGLKNVYRRMQLMYEEESQFKIESKINEGTKISFRIPIKKGEEL